MTRPRLASAALLAVLLAFAVPAQAAEPPMEAPGDFRNGQDNDFGSIAMAPYLSAGTASLPVEARIVLRDLDAVGAAADVLFAFNVKGDAVRATVESLRTADGKAIAPLRTVTVDDGRQPQAHFAPADLLAAARDGRLDLVLAGRVEAKADTQAHVGAMVIAFDEGWAALPSGDGSAQLYGFTMVSAVGVGGGAMPFQGQGNTLAVLPLALAALFGAMAGGTAVAMLARMPPLPAAGAPPPAAAPVPTFGQPSRAAPVAPAPRPAASTPVPATASAAPSPASVPVFGGPASPVIPVRTGGPFGPTGTLGPLGAVRTGQGPPLPVQGPLLPPRQLDRTPMIGAAAEGPPSKPSASPSPLPSASPPVPAPVAVAEVASTVQATRPARPARPVRPARAAQGRPAAGRPAPKPSGGAVLTAAKRPKAKPSRKAMAAPSPSRRPPARKRVAPRANR